MAKYIFTFIIVFIVQISLFSQTKSTKYVHKKGVQKSSSSVKKVAPITKKLLVKPVAKSIIDSTKSTSKVIIDSTKIVKPKIEAEPKQKPITGPISGPASYQEKTKKSEPKTYSNTKNQTKTKAKKHLINTWIKNNLDLGIRFGTNFSTITNFAKLVYSGANIPTEKPFLGYSGGIILVVKSTNKIKFQPEIMFSQQGSQIVEAMNKYKFRINYLKLPLLLRRNFGTKKLSYFFEAGGYLGYAISKKAQREIGGKIFTDKLDFETSYDVFGKKENRFDFGPVIGSGVDYKLKKGTIFLDTKYEHGLSSLILYKSENISGLKNIGQNRVLTASIGFVYFL